jgi:carnitine monooxygenase subunit
MRWRSVYARSMATRAFASVPAANPEDFGLPGWVYHDPEYHAVEMERVIRPAWQIVCHVSDIPNPGDYETIEYLGESIVVVRGADRQVRAFSNVCRHRAMKIVEGAGCVKKLVCPYHAWTYELDGRLSGVPMRADYPALDMAENGLLTVDIELWHGFVFVRLDGDGPSVAEMMAPSEAEVAPYAIADMVPIGKSSTRPRRVNWKNVGDNYSDNLHIPVAHDGLTRLFGKSYAISAHGWIDRMSGGLADKPSANFWERFYQRHLPRNPHLPDAQQRLWLYFKLWPNMAVDLYADQIDFMHWVPTGPTTTELRIRSYALPSDDRTMRLVRYANDRINRTVNAEDTWLIERVQQGMQSRGYTAGPIGASEVCLRNFAARIRNIIPEARLPHAPPAGWSRAQ